jgi:dolichol-phosphate mannosyltransferase
MDADGSRLSVIVPFYNEGSAVSEVLRELRQRLPAAEIIAVDDGSTDDTWKNINAAGGIRSLRFTHNQGQSAAIYYGLRASTRPVVGIMDGDGQNDPASFLPLLAELGRGTADFVCGYRTERHDVWNRRVASRIANGIRRRVLGDGAHDTGCAQKVFRRELIDLLVPFRGMHRYLPAIFRHAGLRMAEVPVNHRPRLCGASKYSNWRRAVHGMRDLLGVAWLLDRQILPPHAEMKP